MRPVPTRSRRNAQTLIETVAGIIFMIPIVLFLFDCGILLLANTANDDLAKQAARAAASAIPNPALTAVEMADPNIRNPKFKAAGKKAAELVVSNYATGKTEGYITEVQLSVLWYNGPPSMALGVAPPSDPAGDPGVGNVAVITSLLCKAPVPFPGFDCTRRFFARAVEPIVSLPPE